VSLSFLTLPPFIHIFKEAFDYLIVRCMLNHQLVLHKQAQNLMLFLSQGFHTCVGSGGQRQTAEWYKENGIEVVMMLTFSYQLFLNKKNTMTLYLKLFVLS